MTAIDGPFAETKEPIAGPLMIEGPGMAEAIRLAGQNPMSHPGYVEIRPVMPRTHSRSGAWAAQSGVKLVWKMAMIY